MLYILTNFQKGDNQWTYGVIDAVKKEFTRRRLDVTETADIKGTVKKCAAHGDVILIPSAFTSRILPIVEECNRLGVPVIIPNGFLNIGERYRYHCVKGDFYGAVAKVLSGLHRAQKENVAIFGTNTNSQEDVLITDAFMAQTGGAANGVFCNEGSIKECFERFFQRRNEFDAVLCVNDYVAISLIENMRHRDPGFIKRTFVVSFSNTLLSRLYNIPFTSLAPDMDALGCAVGDIYRLVKRGSNHYRAISVYVDYKVFERDNVQHFLGQDDLSYESKDVFFPTIQAFNDAIMDNADPEVDRLPKIEIFLNRLTKVELLILMMVLQGYSNVKISEELFLSGETVRYHLNKMRSLLGCATKEDMRDTLSDILDPAQISRYIKEM